MYDKQELERALSIAKIDIMRLKATTFVSTVMCSLETYFDDTIPTAATDGKKILFSPKFFMDLPRNQRAFLVAHETMHVVYAHMLRRGDRDAQKYNCAADYVINYELVQQGLEFIPVGLYDDRYEGMSTEEVYDLLPDNTSNPMDGDIVESDSKEEADKIDTEIKTLISRATQMADMRGAGGSVPTSVRRMLIEMTEPKVDWRVVTKRFFKSLDRREYTWTRRNRRYQEVYLPSVRKRRSLDRLTFALDTSCSVTPKQFDQFISEIVGVFRLLQPKVIDLLQFDHRLQSVEEVKNLKELLEVEFLGRGGTSPEVAIEHFMTTKSKALIMITDGEFGTAHLPKPSQPVIWVIFNNSRFVAPYGKTIHIDLPR